MKNNDKIVEFMRVKNEFTIPEVQKEFSIGYAETRSFFKKLEDREQIKDVGGLKYVYTDTLCCNEDRKDFLFAVKRKAAARSSVFRTTVRRYAVEFRNVKIDTTDMEKRFNLSFAVARAIELDMKKMKLFDENGCIAISVAECEYLFGQKD